MGKWIYETLLPKLESLPYALLIGLGVGLAITKEIVDQHNGTISVESELGKGTTFTLSIPQDAGRSARSKQEK